MGAFRPRAGALTPFISIFHYRCNSSSNICLI